MTLANGTRLGAYEVTDRLGAGGMGVVYRARDARLDRDAAVKVLTALDADPEVVRRFEGEARAASALNHPSIVHIYDIGEAGGVHYIAMELVEGKTLREHLAGRALPVDELLELATQLVDGLAKAHATGIVHRDLKPENLMVTADGFIKILDFGLAKLSLPQLANCAEMQTIGQLTTRPGVLMGTVEYMSPEAARGEAVDFRADQFAVGAILYEMATGQFAFRRASAAQTLAAVIEAVPRPVAELNPGLPASVAEIIDRCLAKRTDGRYATTGDLGRALRAASRGDRRATVAVPAPLAAEPKVPVRLAPHADVSYQVQCDGRVRTLSEAQLRKKLRNGDFSGMELMRRDGEREWAVLHASEVFRDEVPTTGNPHDMARWRVVRGFGGHLFGFVVTLVAIGGVSVVINGGLLTWLAMNWWLGIWALALAGHGLRVLPAAVALFRSQFGARPGLGSPLEPAARELPEAPPIAANPAPASAQAGSPQAVAAVPLNLATRDGMALLAPQLLVEIERVRALLDRRGNDGSGLDVQEVDRLLSAMARNAARLADLAEQTSPAERATLEQTERDTVRRLDEATERQDQELLRRQLRVVRERLESMVKAVRAAERLRVRLSVAEHEIKKLRLDLTRAEARVIDAPELSSRLRFIRHEVDAAEQVDELFADGV